MSTVKGGCCGHLEDIPDTAPRGAGGALHVEHSPYLLGQSSALLMCNRDKRLLGQLPQYGQVSPQDQFIANQHNLGIGAKLGSLTLPLLEDTVQCFWLVKVKADEYSI